MAFVEPKTIAEVIQDVYKKIMFFQLFNVLCFLTHDG